MAAYYDALNYGEAWPIPRPGTKYRARQQFHLFCVMQDYWLEREVLPFKRVKWHPILKLSDMLRYVWPVERVEDLVYGDGPFLRLLPLLPR